MSKSSIQNNKSLGAEEGGDLDSMETLKVQTLVVSDTAEINGSLFVSTMELSSLGSYEQLGPVDFNWIIDINYIYKKDFFNLSHQKIITGELMFIFQAFK